MKLYVLVRKKDLNHSQRAVQAGHAVAEFLLKSSSNWKNTTLIYLGVKGEHQLKNWINKLSRQNIECIPWREPDMNNEITAIATIADSELFKNLNLL